MSLFFARKPFALVVLFCLSTGLLFTGCNHDPNPVPETKDAGFIPLGEWISALDSYIITETNIDYNDGYGNFSGVVEKAVDFSSNAGVIIIKISVSSGDFTVGKYTGIYYSSYTSTGINLANVWLEGGDGWYPLEADSLSAAKSLFNVDNADSHVSYWGVYTKK